LATKYLALNSTLTKTPHYIADFIDIPSISNALPFAGLFSCCYYLPFPQMDLHASVEVNKSRLIIVLTI
jgi:hypothetical protein